jgi:hypothetical protein
LETQDEGLRGSLVLAQMTMQAFASSLQRKGAAVAANAPNDDAAAIANRIALRIIWRA